MIKCILFDRDGTLGELGDKRYPETFCPFANIKSFFQKLQKNGYFVGIITNQSSIARGTALNYDFANEFLGYGVDVWELCPHDTQDGCDCRKPKSGLLLRAAKKLGLAPDECLVVGDRLSDVECAKNVGASAALVLTGYGKNEQKSVLAKFSDTPIVSIFTDIFDIL